MVNLREPQCGRSPPLVVGESSIYLPKIGRPKLVCQSAQINPFINVVMIVFL